MAVLDLGSTIELTGIPAGVNARVELVDLPEDQVARLEGLGLCTGRSVRLLKAGEPCIVRVYGTRIGLARRIAECIRVVLPS